MNESNEQSRWLVLKEERVEGIKLKHDVVEEEKKKTRTKENITIRLTIKINCPHKDRCTLSKRVLQETLVKIYAAFISFKIITKHKKIAM